MYDKLIPELRDDPLGRGYSGMSHAEQLADLWTEYRTAMRPLEHPELTRALAQAGRLAKIKRMSEQWGNQSKDVPVSICMVAMGFVNRDQSRLDPRNPNDVALINALVATEVLSPDDRQALIDAATYTISRLTELEIPDSIEVVHIASAWTQINEA